MSTEPEILDDELDKPEEEEELVDFSMDGDNDWQEAMQKTAGVNNIANVVEETRTDIEKLENMKTAIQGIENKAKWLDTYGIDALISIIPVVGDYSSMLISSYIIWCARKELDLPWTEVGKMVGVLGLDALLGSMTPPGADVFVDYLFQANQINVSLMKSLLKKRIAQTEKEGTEVPTELKEFAEMDLKNYLIKSAKTMGKEMARKKLSNHSGPGTESQKTNV